MCFFNLTDVRSKHLEKLSKMSNCPSRGLCSEKHARNPLAVVQSVGLDLRRKNSSYIVIVPLQYLSL